MVRGKQVGWAGSRGQISDGEGVDALVIEVHGLLHAVDVEFAEVAFRDHGEANALVVLRLGVWGRGCLGLLLGDLKLGGVEVEELGLHILLRGLRSLVLLRLGLLLLRGRLLRCGCRLDLLLELRKTERRRVGAEIVEERGEGRVAKESLDEATVTLVLLEESAVLVAEVVGILGLESNLAFKLTNVFYEKLV